MGEKSLLRKRNFRTFRLFPKEHDLLMNLGRGREEIPDRHAALLELIDIADEMEVPQKEERRAMRVGIPVDLKKVIDRRADESGQTFQDVLLMAVRVYRERYPLEKTENRENIDTPKNEELK